MNKSFYVYAHFLNESAETPFYIGKGKGNRAYSKSGRSDEWKRLTGNGYVVKILKDNLLESEAYKLESELIASYGRISVDGGQLVNLAPGGDIGSTRNKPVPFMLEKFIKRYMFNIALQNYLLEKSSI